MPKTNISQPHQQSQKADSGTVLIKPNTTLRRGASKFLQSQKL